VLIGGQAFIACQQPNNLNKSLAVEILAEAILARLTNYKSINWKYLFFVFKILPGISPKRRAMGGPGGLAWSMHQIYNDLGADLYIFSCSRARQQILVCVQQYIDADSFYG